MTRRAAAEVDSGSGPHTGPRAGEAGERAARPWGGVLDVPCPLPVGLLPGSPVSQAAPPQHLPTVRTVAFVMALLGCLLIMYKAIWYDQFTCPDGFLLRVRGHHRDVGARQAGRGLTASFLLLASTLRSVLGEARDLVVVTPPFKPEVSLGPAAVDRVEVLSTGAHHQSWVQALEPLGVPRSQPL